MELPASPRHDLQKKIAHATEYEREDKKGMRYLWFDNQNMLDPRWPFFNYETGANAKMARVPGRSRRSPRCRLPVPCGFWKNKTRTPAFTIDGLWKPILPYGFMDREAFWANFAQPLTPELCRIDIAIMYNLPADEVSGPRQTSETKGATLLNLPTYPPDFTPIYRASFKSLFGKGCSANRGSPME